MEWSEQYHVRMLTFTCKYVDLRGNKGEEGQRRACSKGGCEWVSASPFSEEQAQEEVTQFVLRARC